MFGIDIACLLDGVGQRDVDRFHVAFGTRRPMVSAGRRSREPSGNELLGDRVTGASFDLHGEVEGVDRHGTVDIFRRKVGVISVVSRSGATRPHGGDDRIL